MKLEKEKLTGQKAWDRFYQDSLQWIKLNTDNKQGIDKFQQLMGKIKQKLQESSWNEGGKYFDKFAQTENNLYITQQVRIQKIQLSMLNISNQKYLKIKKLFEEKKQQEQKQESVPNSSIVIEQNYFQRYNPQIIQLRKLLFQNHLKFIQYLTKQQFSFKYIPRHILGQKSESVFNFRVERGIKINQYLKNSKLILPFIRDVAKCIQQLEENHIFHADLNFHNFLLYNCVQEDLLNIEQLSKVIDKIQFKVIDFGDALFMGILNRQLTQNIIKKRKKIKTFISKKVFVQYIEEKPQKLVNLENFLQNDTYKQIHKKIFQEIIGGYLDNVELKQKSKQIIKFIKKGEYKELVLFMQAEITKQIKNASQ